MARSRTGCCIAARFPLQHWHPLAGALHGLLLLPVLLSLIGPDPVDAGAHAAVNGASKTKALEMAAVPNGKAAPGSGDYAA